MRRHHVQVNITTNDDCQERALGGVKIESSMLCAGGEGTGSGLVSKNYNHIMYFKFTLRRLLILLLFVNKSFMKQFYVKKWLRDISYTYTHTHKLTHIYSNTHKHLGCL